MHAWPKFHGSSPYNFWENDLNTKSLCGRCWRRHRKNNTYVSLLLRRRDKNRDFLLLCHYLQMYYITETRTRYPNWYNFPTNSQVHSAWVIIVFSSHLYNGKLFFSTSCLLFYEVLPEIGCTLKRKFLSKGGKFFTSRVDPHWKWRGKNEMADLLPLKCISLLWGFILKIKLFFVCPNGANSLLTNWSPLRMEHKI